jgi:hypothetical protein
MLPRAPERFGDYELVERLGVGGMAETFVAVRRGPRDFEQRVCLKRILPPVAVRYLERRGVGMVRRTSFVLLALVVACGGSSEDSGGTAGSGGTGGMGGSAGVVGQGGTGGSAVACIDNVCSCDEAGIRAAISEGGGPFTFNCDGPTTVGTEAEIVIDSVVVLDGEGNLTVDANEAHRVFSVPENVTVELRGFTVTKGLVVDQGHGAGILNDGTLTLANCIVSENGTNSSGVYGGGIHNSGTLTLSDTTVSGNMGLQGGGINNPGTLTLTHTTVSGNTASEGGGIANLSGTLSLTNSAVSGNTAISGSGGGITNILGTLTLTNSTVSGNSGAWAGGINNHTGPLTLTNSTVSGNTTLSKGGGIANYRGPVTLTNSTVSGNTADEGGGGIFNWGPLTLTNSLVDGDCELGVGPSAPIGSISSNGYTIESPGDTCGFDQPTDQVNVSAGDLKLGPLADNGGPTMTHALLAGSVAINVILAQMCQGDEDQRGEPRPGHAKCDVGAFEVQP